MPFLGLLSGQRTADSSARSYNKQSLDRAGQETSSVLWCKGLEFTDIVILYYDNHRTGLFLFIYLKMYPTQKYSRKAHSVRKMGDSAPLTSSDWIWSTTRFREGRWLLSVSVQTLGEPRHTWIMHEVIWKSCIKSLICNYLSLILLEKNLSPLAITFIYQLFQRYAFKIIANIFLTLSSKFSIWKAIKRYPQICFWERLNSLISVVDRYDATSHSGEEKEKDERKKSSQPSVRRFTA